MAEARDDAGLPGLRHVIDEWLSDPSLDDEAAYQAVFGLADLPDPAIGELRRIAEFGRDRPQAFAREWLRYSTIAH